MSKTKRSAALSQKCRSQKIQSGIQLDHSFYKIPGEHDNLKVLTFLGTVTSTSGAVIVPDFSASQDQFFSVTVIQVFSIFRAIRIGLADHFEVHSDQVEGSFMPWITQHAVYQINSLLTFSLNSLLRKCRFARHLESHMRCG